MAAASQSATATRVSRTCGKYTRGIIGKLAFACGLQASPPYNAPGSGPHLRLVPGSKSDIVLPENLF